MEKPNLFESDGDDPTLSWLASMQPASADALKPNFLYRAGYEAAQVELLNKIRRHLVIGSAALLLVALGAGTLVFQLGSRHGQVLATRQTHADVVKPSHDQRPVATPNDLKDQSATDNATESPLAHQPAPSAAHKAAAALTTAAPDQTPAISRWWQSQLQQCFAGTATKRALTHPLLEFGRTGAGWDDIAESTLQARRAVSLVAKSSAPKSPGPKPAVKEAPTVSPSVRLRGSLLPLRDSQLQSLMNELL